MALCSLIVLMCR